MKLKSRLMQVRGEKPGAASPMGDGGAASAASFTAHSSILREPGLSSVENEPDGDGYLSPHELRYRTQMLSRLLSVLDLARIATLDKDEARAQIQSLAYTMLNEENYPLNADSRKRVVEAIEFEILGLGPLEYLLRDRDISDIMVNGAKCTFVERRGRLRRSDVVFDDSAHLMRIIDRIVSQVGRRVDESAPMVDARLQDGSRVNVIVPPLALDGPALSIRRFPSAPLKLADLVQRGALSAEMAQVLTAAVRIGCNILISGGTGSGKTTTLNALSAYIPRQERIITIEDAAELQMLQPHVVRLETRPANMEGRGEISQRDLVRNALRMRPDRIIVGEVRGQEALDMLQAMNTGHDGSMSTIHANTPRDALSRLENMVAMTGYDLPARAVRGQIASALDLVIQVNRLEDGSRRMISITEIVGMEGDIITMAELFSFQRQGVEQDGRVIGQFKPTGVLPTFIDELRRRGMDLNLAIFDPRQTSEAH